MHYSLPCRQAQSLIVLGRVCCHHSFPACRRTSSRPSESTMVGSSFRPFIRNVYAPPPVQADPSSKVEMQTEIACKALDVLLLLLSGDGDEEEGKRAERQSVVAGAEEGMLSEMLAHVAFSRAETFCRSPIKCQERAMRATGALVDRHPTNQYNMGEVRPCGMRVRYAGADDRKSRICCGLGGRHCGAGRDMK